jgi:hypothetical protein
MGNPKMTSNSIKNEISIVSGISEVEIGNIGLKYVRSV